MVCEIMQPSKDSQTMVDFAGRSDKATGGYEHQRLGCDTVSAGNSDKSAAVFRLSVLRHIEQPSSHVIDVKIASSAEIKQSATGLPVRWNVAMPRDQSAPHDSHTTSATPFTLLCKDRLVSTRHLTSCTCLAAMIVSVLNFTIVPTRSCVRWPWPMCIDATGGRWRRAPSARRRSTPR